MTNRFQGKVVIVTGSSSGIGQAAALNFGKEGASLVIHGQDIGRLNVTELLLIKIGVHEDKILKVAGSMEQDGTAAKIINETVKKFGKIDVLVNNAATPSKPRDENGKLHGDSLENMDYLYKVNLRSHVEMTQLATPYLEKTKGNIVNVSSVGSTKPFPNAWAYCSLKAAVDHFTRNSADHLGSKGIRINCLKSFA